MKHLRLALAAFVSSLGLAYAQDDEARRAPPVEIPDFSNLDEYIYEPKSTLVFGIRYVSGAKVGFTSTRGSIASRGSPGDLVAPDGEGRYIDPTTGQEMGRFYHDGAVQPDTRSSPVVDANGNPVINPDTGLPTFQRLPADGRTNTWNYSDLSQLSRPGFIAFRDYSADIIDTATRTKETNSSMGVDLAVHRDMGKLFGGRLAWNLTAGVSINDIAADTSAPVLARINTLTDYYRYTVPANGTLPDPPYSAPSQLTETVLDADGNPVLTLDGTNEVRVTDTTVLLDAAPQQRENTSATNELNVTNRWKVKGAYYTFRAGPTLWIPFTSRLRASVSAGAALVYSGTTYTVTETLIPDVGTEISETESSEEDKLLPGWYADATLQFDLTERAGFYAGAIYQSAGNYTHTVENASTHYSTKIDLSKQSGVRAGMTIRF